MNRRKLPGKRKNERVPHMRGDKSVCPSRILYYVHTDGVCLHQDVREDNSLILTNSVVEKPESRLFASSTAFISNNIFVDNGLTIDSGTQLIFVENTFIGYS